MQLLSLVVDIRKSRRLESLGTQHWYEAAEVALKSRIRDAIDAVAERPEFYERDCSVHGYGAVAASECSEEDAMLHTQAGSARSTDRARVAITTPNAIKASVTVLRKKGDGKVIDLNRPLTLCGSHREVKIRLKHESVAPVHCALINTGSRLLLRDFASRAGTRVNGKRARFAELRNGDVIRIDAWKFRVNLKSCSDTCSGSSIMATLFSAQPSLDIEHTAGGDVWKNLPDVFVIGRRDTCEVQIDSTNVSRAHALVFCLNGCAAIFDLMSANGLAVNGEKTSMAYLAQGDVVAVGDKKLRIAEVRGAATPECQESVYDFGDATADRIKLADPGGQGSSVDYVRFGGFEPKVADHDRFAGDIEKAHHVGPSADEKLAELDGREAKLRDREREIDDHQADLGKRELELGDREHQLGAAARKLVDENHAKLADATARARAHVDGQAEALRSQQAALDELRADIECRGRAMLESESQLVELGAALEQRRRDLDERETNLRQESERCGDAEDAIERLRAERADLRADQDALLDRETAVAERTDAVAGLRSECEALRVQLDRDHRAMGDQAAELERRAADAASQEAYCATLSQELAARDEAITLRRRETEARDAATRSTEAELAAREELLAGRFAEVADREDRLKGQEHDQRIQAQDFEACESALAEREQAVTDRLTHVDECAGALASRELDIEARGHALSQRAEEYEKLAHRSRGELDAAWAELAAQRAGLARARAASEHEQTTALTEKIAKVEAEMAARERVIQALEISIEQREAEIDGRECELNTREPLLNERSKSLDHRADELDKHRREMTETRVECESRARELNVRLEQVRQREGEIKADERDACQGVSPLAISDERSFEVVRLLDPTLGDSVRVLRRLGVRGSFDELIALAQQELAAHEDKKQRGKWNPFR